MRVVVAIAARVAFCLLISSEGISAEPNLLVNGDFETGSGPAAPRPWQAALTSPEVNNQAQGAVEAVAGGVAPGQRALRFRKLATALYWPQVWNWGYRLEPGAAYEFSVMVHGNLPEVTLRVNARFKGGDAKLSQRFPTPMRFGQVRICFVAPNGAEAIGVGLAAPTGAAGEVLFDNAILRRLPATDVAEELFTFVDPRPDWSPDPDPIHGLTAVAERAGHKPWDLCWRDGKLLGSRTIFHDRRFGSELWLLDNSPASEPGVTASIWPGWNADGSVLMLPGRRGAPQKPYKPWLANADFSRLTPLETGGTPLWDLDRPEVFYTHTPGKVERVNLRTGERRVLATWQPRDRERAYGLTKDNRSVFVSDHDGGLWVRYRPGDRPLPYIEVLDCYGQALGGQGIFRSHLAATTTPDGTPVFRIGIGTRVYTDTGRTERVIVPLSGRAEYLNAFAGGRVEFPADARRPDTRDIAELFRVYHLYPSCSHGHLSYSPDGEYTCWDGSPSVYRTRDGQDRHDVRISPNGYCYHTCWLVDPRFFVTCVRSYREAYDRPPNGNLLCQVFPDGTWQAVADIKMRPNAFYYGGNFATLSRDGTKIHYASSMLATPKNYMAVLARPQPPRELAWTAEPAAVVLSWRPPPHAREIRGYLVYRSRRSGDGYELLTREPMRASAGGERVSYRDTAVVQGTPYYYVVTSLEHSGLESGYSAEAAQAGRQLPPSIDEPLVVYAECEAALVDLGSADRPGLSLGRDCRTASNWYYVYRTPRAKQGAATLAVPIPARGDYYVWLRVRRAAASAAGQWQVRVGQQAAGTVACDSTDWAWQRAASRPTALDHGSCVVQLSTSDANVQADAVCLTTRADLVPQGPRPEDRQTPAEVRGLTVSGVHGRAVHLTWQPCTAADFAHYNLYAAREPIRQPKQEHLLMSPCGAEAVDWGLRPATQYYYAVTAVDRRGNESPLGPVVTVATPTAEHPAAEIELRFDQAQLDGNPQRATAPGTRAGQYVMIPENTPPADAARVRASWSVDLPHAGRYYCWLRYLPRGAPSTRAAAVPQNLTLAVDGRRVTVLGGGDTDLSIQDKAIRPELWTWARPVTHDLVGVDLKAGPHTLTLGDWTPGVRYDVLVLTNEPAFLPSDGRLRQR